MASHPSSSLAGLLLLASRIACLIVAASFVVFVVDQTGSASTHQQNVLAGNASSSDESGSSSSTAKESSLHRTLDEAANALTSPFAGVVSGADSEWVTELVRTVLALLAYGLGVAFLVRIIRIRA